MALDLSKAMVARGKIGEMDRSFDYEFWRRQSLQTKMTAIWDMTLFGWMMKGRDPGELRLDRTAVRFQPKRGSVSDHRRLRRRLSRVRAGIT
jgi:hypothetical protein